MPSSGQSLPLSGVIVCKNEADRIGRCVASLLPVCAEIVVLDSGSTDDTVAIARGLGATVDHQDWLGFARQKNAAIERASQPWVILLDADEWLQADAQQRLRGLFEEDRVEQADVWQLPRRTHYLGHPMRGGSFAREPVERLFRAHLRHAVVPVHEYLDTRGQRVRLSDIRLEHDTARNAGEYWRKLQGYARLWANQQAARGKRSWPGRGMLAALAYAAKNLLLRGGLVDGLPGLRFHWLHMRYVALKYALLRHAATEPGG